MRFVYATILLLISLSLSANQQYKAQALNEALMNMCNKNIVLLGEDTHHGSGKTTELKLAIIKKLVEECNFTAVFFESPVYEFLNFDREAKSKEPSVQQLSQSIGGLWSEFSVTQPLISYLFEKSRNKKVRLFGIDPQLAANQPFTQKELPKKLSSFLGTSSKEYCLEELNRYLNWQYSSENPYGPETKSKIASCISKMQKSIEEAKSLLPSNDESLDDELFMVQNMRKYFTFERKNYFNQRDLAMAENFNWYYSKLPVNSKVIVWTASIHAGKTLTPRLKGKTSMGAHLKQTFNERMFSLGFTASSGEFGRTLDKTVPIKASKLEKLANLTGKDDLKYLNISELSKLGVIDSQAITYGKIDSVDWSKVFDGLLIMSAETPISKIHL